MFEGVMRIFTGRSPVGKRSHLDLVPDEYYDAVKRLAKRAYHAKGQGMTMAAFTDKMAEQWLAQNEIFKTIAARSGFIRKGFISAHERRPALALTLNGSIIGVDEANGSGQRWIRYERIDIREDTAIKKRIMGILEKDLRLNKGLQAQGVKKAGIYTSDIIALAVLDVPADQMRSGNVNQRLEDTIITLANTCNTMMRAVWVVPNK